MTYTEVTCHEGACFFRFSRPDARHGARRPSAAAGRRVPPRRLRARHAAAGKGVSRSAALPRVRQLRPRAGQSRGAAVHARRREVFLHARRPLRREVYARCAAQRGLLRRGGHCALRHTHRALSETMQGLYVVNPGTAGVGAMCTYACIETRDGAIRSAGIHAIPEAWKMLPRPCEGAFCCFVYFSRNVT